MNAQHNVSDKTIPVEYGEVGVLAVLIFLGGVCIYPSNAVTNFLIPEVLTSVAYSQTVGAGLLILCAIQAVFLIVKHAKGEGSKKTINLTFALIGSLLIVVYGLVFSYIGFYLATVSLMLVFSYYLEDKEERSVKRSVLFTVLTTAVVAGVFKIFKIYLPPALLF
ncbi:MAG: hypothetical protein DELT_00845 [Desulfovibrio sp.]